MVGDDLGVTPKSVYVFPSDHGVVDEDEAFEQWARFCLLIKADSFLFERDLARHDVIGGGKGEK